MTTLVATERLGRVLVATLARAPVNALDERMIAALHAVLDEAEADDTIAVLHLRSEQRAFSAGADLALIESCLATPDGADRMSEVVRDMQRLFARLEAAPLVTLAEIGAPALGGGLEMALGCDLRVAAHEARLGLPEVRLGLLPGAGGTQRLTWLCGPGLAKRLILGAELIDGSGAERLGLVQWAVPHAQLAYFAAQIAQRYAAMPRAALAASKRCIAAAHNPQRDGFADELAETRRLYDQPDTRARVSEFLAARAR